MRSARVVLSLCLVLVAALGRAADTGTAPNDENDSAPLRVMALKSVVPGNGTLSKDTSRDWSQRDGTINPSLIVPEPIAPLGPTFVGSPVGEHLMANFFSRARDISQRLPQ